MEGELQQLQVVKTKRGCELPAVKGSVPGCPFLTSEAAGGWCQGTPGALGRKSGHVTNAAFYFLHRGQIGGPSEAPA